MDYQNIALDLSAAMQTEGWASWQLRPSDQAAAGIAAAIYYITGIAKPWIILPLNAAVHATSALLLLLIVGAVTKWSKPSIWPVLPFILFPTALLWNSQFHKDNFFIFGAYLFLFGLLQLVTIDDHKQMLRLGGGFALMVSGIIFIWVVRPYGVEMVFYIGLVLALGTTIYLLFNLKYNRRVVYNIIVLWLALFAAYPLTGTGFHHRFVPVEYEDLAASPVIETASAFNQAFLGIAIEVLSPVSPQTQGPGNWQPSTLLPGFVDENLYKLAIMRDRYLVHKPEAGSNIDLDVRFSSATDLIKYTPRALQIGLFAPFPTDWFAPGDHPAASLMRTANAFEMLLIYLALLALLICFRAWYKNPKAYIALGFTLGMILSYALVVANVGTLNRLRYGFILTLVALGITYWLERKKGAFPYEPKA